MNGNKKLSLREIADTPRYLYSASSTGAVAYTQQFGYDNTTAKNDPQGRYGNVTCTSANGAPCAQLTFNPQNNRITSIGNQTPTYDAAGEMLSDGTGTGSTQYTWNAEGRMATVTPYGGATATYVYDGDGHRVEDTMLPTLFWYGANGKLVGVTSYGTVNVQSIDFAGRRISKFVLEPSGPWGADFYDDTTGSVRLETDDYGNTNCRSDYYPFGGPVGSGCSLYESFQYAGLYTDAGQEDGGYSATNRRYNDIYYRWFSPDPLGGDVTNPQSLNRYAYALNNPTTLDDPLGSQPGSNCVTSGIPHGETNPGQPLPTSNTCADGGDPNASSDANLGWFSNFFSAAYNGPALSGPAFSAAAEQSNGGFIAAHTGITITNPDGTQYTFTGGYFGSCSPAAGSLSNSCSPGYKGGEDLVAAEQDYVNAESTIYAATKSGLPPALRPYAKPAGLGGGVKASWESLFNLQTPSLALPAPLKPTCSVSSVMGQWAQTLNVWVKNHPGTPPPLALTEQPAWAVSCAAP